MITEDNSGFVRFPIVGRNINQLDGTTIIYLVAFDSKDVSNQAYELSNLRLLKTGNLVADDILSHMSLENTADEYEKIYFPNSEDRSKLKKVMSMPLTTCICIGWSEHTFEIRDTNNSDDFIDWCASFHDLTNEGKKLYYSIKKLHNNKEVRILTFKNSL